MRIRRLRESELSRARATRLGRADVRAGGFRRSPRSRLQPDRVRRTLTRQLRSVSTSDVASTSAPQTTCTLLIQTSRRLSTVSAPSVTCTATSDEQQRRRPRELAPVAVVGPDVAPTSR